MKSLTVVSFLIALASQSLCWALVPSENLYYWVGPSFFNHETQTREPIDFGNFLQIQRASAEKGEFLYSISEQYSVVPEDLTPRWERQIKRAIVAELAPLGQVSVSEDRSWEWELSLHLGRGPLVNDFGAPSLCRSCWREPSHFAVKIFRHDTQLLLSVRSITRHSDRRETHYAEGLGQSLLRSIGAIVQS